MKPSQKKSAGFQKRTYRTRAAGRGLVSFELTIAETDLQIFAARLLTPEADAAVRRVRRDIEMYAALHNGFVETLEPVIPDADAPEPVRRMCTATAYYGVGPMAAVAGVVAETVGRELLALSPQVIIENGGDIFFHTDEPPVFGLFAGPDSPFNGLRFTPGDLRSGGVCTSSGTVGHSISFGKADAVAVVSRDAILADAAATAICNRIQSAADIEPAIAAERERGLVDGLLIAVGDAIGAWGQINIIQGD